jgi:hypothetical protein
VRIESLNPGWAKLVRPYLKNKNKKTGSPRGMGDVVEYFPSTRTMQGPGFNQEYHINSNKNKNE